MKKADNHPIVGAYKDGLATIEEAALLLTVDKCFECAADAKKYLQKLKIVKNTK